MAKLTLSVDERVIARAKRYAQARGTSVSGLVEQMLDLAASGSDHPDVVPPVLSRLRGSLKGVDRTDYRRYLERKYPMKRVLVDVNVILDVLLDRKPFADASSAVWAAIERGDAEGLLSAHAVTTLHYLNAKAVGVRVATETTDALLSVFDVAPIDEAVLRSAISLEWKDFEDAVTAAGARRAKCDAVITRNPRDFKGAPVRVLTPAEAVAWIEASA